MISDAGYLPSLDLPKLLSFVPVVLTVFLLKSSRDLTVQSASFCRFSWLPIRLLGTFSTSISLSYGNTSTEHAELRGYWALVDFFLRDDSELSLDPWVRLDMCLNGDLCSLLEDLSTWNSRPCGITFLSVASLFYPVLLRLAEVTFRRLLISLRWFEPSSYVWYDLADIPIWS